MLPMTPVDVTDTLHAVAALAEGHVAKPERGAACARAMSLARQQRAALVAHPTALASLLHGLERAAHDSELAPQLAAVVYSAACTEPRDTAAASAVFSVQRAARALSALADAAQWRAVELLAETAAKVLSVGLPPFAALDAHHVAHVFAAVASREGFNDSLHRKKVAILCLKAARALLVDQASLMCDDLVARACTALVPLTADFADAARCFSLLFMYSPHARRCALDPVLLGDRRPVPALIAAMVPVRATPAQFVASAACRAVCDLARMSSLEEPDVRAALDAVAAALCRSKCNWKTDAIDLTHALATNGDAASGARRVAEHARVPAAMVETLATAAPFVRSKVQAVLVCCVNSYSLDAPGANLPARDSRVAMRDDGMAVAAIDAAGDVVSCCASRASEACPGGMLLHTSLRALAVGNTHRVCGIAYAGHALLARVEDASMYVIGEATSATPTDYGAPEAALLLTQSMTRGEGGGACAAAVLPGATTMWTHPRENVAFAAAAHKKCILEQKLSALDAEVEARRLAILRDFASPYKTK